MTKVLKIAVVSACLVWAANASGSELETAVKLYSHMTGVQPPLEVAQGISELLEDDKIDEALALITASSDFYNVKLRNMFSPWSNAESSADVPMNDMVATLIGVVRDGKPFDTAFYEDIVYVGTAEPPYSPADNLHYRALDTNGADLKESLSMRKQSELNGLPTKAISGILSSRGYAASYFEAGTNRAATAFALKHFLCHDMELLQDITRADFRVRRDIDRQPGGDPKVFRNRCVGCHSGMDAVGGWAAYHNFADGRLVYTDGVVQPKMNNNTYVFPDGYVVTDDSWMNLWVKGPNADLGWPETQTTGKGARSFAKMLTQTEAFSTCMATTVFVNVCHQDPAQYINAKLINDLGNRFSEKFDFKALVHDTASLCLLGTQVK